MKQRILNTVMDVYGEETPVAILSQEGGMLRLWEVVCMSSMAHNLGNCLCVNHPSSVEDTISTEEVVSRFGIEALDGFEEPSEAQIIFDAFGIEVEELETYMRIAYYLGSNPLPRLRARTRHKIIFSENPDSLTFPEEGEPIFVVNSHGEIAVR